MNFLNITTRFGPKLLGSVEPVPKGLALPLHLAPALIMLCWKMVESGLLTVT
uniref:Uncharacterized protein n=1 Tax=Solanum tuberosum TaxID=4113 RepID=M1AT91_SOLTU